MALPTGWNCRTGNVQELFENSWNNAIHQNQPRQPRRKFFSEPIRFSTISISNPFSLTRSAQPLFTTSTAPWSLFIMMLPPLSTIEFLYREWQRIKVWPVLFVRYESANPLDKLFKMFDAHLLATHSIFLHYQPELYAN